MKFKDWFDNKLTVGSFPIMNNQFFNKEKYDICINVSDEYYQSIDDIITEKGCKTFWFPMNETKKDIGLNSIYGALAILYSAEIENKRVYLHCHSGVNRSQLVRCCFHYMRAGSHLENRRSEKHFNQMFSSSSRGYLPPMAEFEKFLKELGGQLENVKGRPMGGTLDYCKKEHLNNF
jgi:hypothetical protein